MQVEVLKKFSGAGTTLTPGQIVDASDWRLLRPLINQRYVREHVVKAKAPAKPSKES